MKRYYKNYSQKFKDGFGLSHGPLIQDFINTLNAGSIDAPISIYDGIQSMKLVHSIYKSAESGEWINLEDNIQSDFLGL